MYILTEKTGNVIVAISETLDHQENGNPLVHNGTLAIGFPVNEHTVEEVPTGVAVTTHTYDGTSFGFNPNYPFEAEAREKRDKLLAETDWTELLDAAVTAKSHKLIRAYRQALRDVPQQDGFPHNITWPEKPTIVKGPSDPVDVAVDTLIGGNNNA